MTSNAPTADRLRHAETIEPPRVDAASFRQGWRVRTRLDALLADRRIERGVWQIAVEYRDAWSRVLAQGGGEIGGMRIGGAGYDRHERMLAVLRTLTRLRAAEEAIGGLAARLCFQCAVEDQSWAAIGRAEGRNPETVRNWTADALRRLAGAWPTRRLGGLAAWSPPPEPKSRLRAS